MPKKRARKRDFADAQRIENVGFKWDDGALLVIITTAGGDTLYTIGPNKTLQAIEQAKRTLQWGRVLPYRRPKPEH